MAPETAVTGAMSLRETLRSKYRAPDVASGAERRFAVPESYGESRVRIVARDPQTLFAYWELAPGALAELRRELGSRLVAVSPVTLRLSEPGTSWTESVFVSGGGRSEYVPVDGHSHALRAEVGLTLPWGEFRCLATSRTVTPPRLGGVAAAATTTTGAGGRSKASTAAATMSWAAARALTPAAAREALSRTAPAPGARVRRAPVKRGGASESFQGGASDRFQR